MKEVRGVLLVLLSQFIFLTYLVFLPDFIHVILQKMESVTGILYTFYKFYPLLMTVTVCSIGIWLKIKGWTMIISGVKNK